MPVLPTFTPADIGGAIDRGARQYSGLMERSRQAQRARVEDQQRDRDIEHENFVRGLARPALIEKQKLELATSAAGLKNAEYDARRKQQAIEEELDAQKRLEWVSSLTDTKERREATALWLTDFGGLTDYSPVIKNLAGIAQKDLANIDGAEAYRAKQQIDDETRRLEAAKARNARIEEQRKELTATYGEEFRFGVPIPLPGNSGKAAVYSPGVDQPQIVDLQDQARTGVNDQALRDIRTRIENNDAAGARILWAAQKAKLANAVLFGQISMDDINKMEADLFKAPTNTPSVVPTPSPAPILPSGGPVQITGDEDYAKLAPGTRFIGPDGVTRTKP